VMLMLGITALADDPHAFAIVRDRRLGGGR
jgi:hypothetical protein